MKRKTALVTGACGFIGSHMVDYLLRLGWVVVATDTDRAFQEKLDFIRDRWGSNGGNFWFFTADLTDPPSLDDAILPALRQFNFDAVFHIAAVFNYSASPQLLHQVNVEGTYNLLKAVKENCPKPPSVVVWSSGSVYGVTGYEAVYETDRVNPKNNYERSKLEQEKVAFDFAREYGLALSVIRPAAVYGSRSKYGAAVPIMMIASGQIPFVIGSGEFVESFVHVEDVCRAAEFIAENSGKTSGQIYNVCDNSRYSIEEMFLWVEKCLQNAGRKDVQLLRFGERLFHYPTWALKPLMWWNKWRYVKRGLAPKVEQDLIDYIGSPFLMSNTKLRLLGFELAHPDAKAGIKEMIEWYKKEGLL